MALSIREQIIGNIQATIAGVKQSAGYQVDIRTVERVRRTEYQAHEYPAVSIIEGEEKKADGPTGQATCFLPLVIEISVYDNTDFSAAAGQALASVQKAIRNNRTCGGLAIDVVEESNKMFLEDAINPKPAGGHRVLLNVEYRHAENDPYLQG